MRLNVKFDLTGDFDVQDGKELDELVKAVLESGAESCACDVRDIEVIDCDWSDN